MNIERKGIFKDRLITIRRWIQHNYPIPCCNWLTANNIISQCHAEKIVQGRDPSQYFFNRRINKFWFRS
jgi:hypothetical protein